MKTNILLLSFCLCLPLWANEDGGKADQAAQFAKHKQEMAQGIDAQISMLQTLKSCVSSAQDGDGMKKCHEEQDKRQKEMQAQHEQKRKEQIDEQIKHLQDEKAKMDQKK